MSLFESTSACHFKTSIDSSSLVINFERNNKNLTTLTFIEKAALLHTHILALPHLENLAITAESVFGYGGDGIKHISDIFSTLINLTSLSVNLSKNYLGFKGIEILSNSLINLIHLQILQVGLNFNKISNLGVEYLC